MGHYRFLKLRDGLIGKHPAKEVVAQKADGTPYEKKFFANNKELIDQFNKFESGSWIEIKFDDTRYKNIMSVGPGQEPAPYVGKPAGGGPVAQAGGGFRKDGTSRGEDTNRSAAIYLAANVVTHAIKEPESPDHMLGAMFDIVESINAYITSGVIPAIDVGDTEDPLEPPDID